MNVAVSVWHLDKDSWTRFAVTAPDRNKPEAERLNARLAGWAFETGAWKDKSLVPSIDDLKAATPEPAKAEAPAAEAPKTESPKP